MAAPRTAARRAPQPAPPAARTQTSGSRTPGGMADARVSSILSGKRLYRMSDGRLIELPKDMTTEDAARLESEAKAAQQKIGKGPPPQPVPDVRKPADKSEKKAPAKPEKKGKSGSAAAGGAARSGRVVARLSIKGGVAAKYLLGKAAPVLAKGIGLLRTLSRNEQTHDNAAQKLLQAEKAVVNPASENQSRSNTAQVGALGARPAPPVDAAKGTQTLQASLAENVPRSIEDVDKFKRDKKGQHIGADVLGVMQGDKNAVVSTFADMERTPPPAPPEQVAEPLPPTEIAPGTASMNLGAGAVAPLQPAHTDVSQYTKQADSKLTEEGVTQEQLDMVDSGDLASANKEKKNMEQTAKAEPLAIRGFAQQQTAKLDQDLKQEEKTQRGALVAKRKFGLGSTQLKQRGAKSALEKKRDEVAAKINGIHKAAQDKVKKKLADLETQAMKRFDDGNAAATKAFEDNVNREIDAFKDDRYSGVFGWARKAKDWLLGMDDLPAVKAIFDRNRARFVSTIDKLVADIGADNKRTIQDCKDELERARGEIKAYVDKLGPELKDIGKKTAGEVNRQLEEMDGFIRKKEEDLQQKLADKQQAAIKAIDDKIEKMKDAMSGALSKLGKLLLWAAKKFFTWALSKFGYSLSEIEGIINKGAAVLKAIFTKPIVFVKNLMKAAMTGFTNFKDHFPTHLKDAVFEWLTGSLEGFKLPSTWDLQGIVGFALQMIGISYKNLRKHMVTVMTEPVVDGLEKSFTLVKTLITEGPMAAWEQLKEMAEDIKKTFVDTVKDFIKTKIIQEAIKWVVSLFIPGAGIIKAVIGIYDTVVFFIQKAKQIAKMIGSFLGSIGEIAAGNIGAAAQAMEDGLARGLSLVISFLAQLLHLDGITAKIRSAIEKIRGKVDEVLLKVAKWIAGKAKALIARGVGAVKSGIAAVVQWWKARKQFTVGKETHTLFFQGEGPNARPMIASVPEDLETYYKNLKKTHAAAKPEMKAIDTAIKAITKLRQSNDPNDREKNMTQADGLAIKGHFEVIAKNVVALEGGDIPQSSAAWTSKTVARSVLGKSVMVLPLTMRAGKDYSGSSPYDTTPVWDSVNTRKSKYVRGHLLNHNLHGPGSNKNMAPITRSLNGLMASRMENPVKTAVFSKGLFAKYSVILEYGAHSNRSPTAGENWIDEERYLPTRVKMTANEITKEPSGAWKEQKKLAPDFDELHELPPDIRPEGIPPVNLWTASAAEMTVIPGIGPVRARAIVLLRAKKKREGQSRFHSYDDLQPVGIPDSVLKLLKKEGSITLF